MSTQADNSKLYIENKKELVEVISIREATHLSGMTKDLLHYHVGKGRIETIKRKGRLYIILSTLEDFLKEVENFKKNETS